MDEDKIVNPLLDDDEREVLEDESYIEFLSNVYESIYDDDKDTKEEDELLKQFGL